MELFIYEITLPGDSEFAARFNKVSETYANWQAVGADEKVITRLYNIDSCFVEPAE